MSTTFTEGERAKMHAKFKTGKNNVATVASDVTISDVTEDAIFAIKDGGSEPIKFRRSDLRVTRGACAGNTLHKA